MVVLPLRVQLRRSAERQGAESPPTCLQRDFDVNAPNLMDNRRLSGRRRVAFVCMGLHADGTPHRRAATHDGAVLVETRRRKERICPELLLPGGRARLSWRWKLAGGGRLWRWYWFVSLGESKEMERLGGPDGCPARSFASSLLELRGGR